MTLSATDGSGSTEDRTAARVILRDVEGRLLLFCGMDPHDPEVAFWFTPGGGLDPGETFAEAAGRELREEAGVVVTALGDAVWEEDVEFALEGVVYRQGQRFFAVELDVSGSALEIDSEGWTDLERRTVSRTRWWSLAELETTTETIYPTGLVGLVRSISRWGSASPA